MRVIERLQIKQATRISSYISSFAFSNPFKAACRFPKKSSSLPFKESLAFMLLMILLTAIFLRGVTLFPPVFSPSEDSIIHPMRTYGGKSSVDEATDIVQTIDGGFAISGFTYSYGVGSRDAFLMKIDSTGQLSWMQTFGGSGFDHGYSLIQTQDGGFALAGYTDSFGAGGWDGWIVKTNTVGLLEWTRTFGGSDSDVICDLVETVDGEFALTGHTSSFGRGYSDIWLIKTDSNGYLQWQTTFGGNSSDYAYALVSTPDGGFTLVGSTWPYHPPGGSISFERRDYFLLKTDRFGVEVWNQTYYSVYTSSSCNGVSDLILTFDGGYAISDCGHSSEGRNSHMWLLKVDKLGKWQWSSSFQWENFEYAGADSLVQTSDGGYALVGFAQTYHLKPSRTNVFLVKTDSNGKELWKHLYGESQVSLARGVVQNEDGGFTFVGSQQSTFPGSKDIWMVTTDSNGDILREFSYGDTESLSVTVMKTIQTSDGAFALIGSFSNDLVSSNAWLAKTDIAGRIIWNQTFSKRNDDVLHDLIQTRDGGFAVVGSTRSNSAGKQDVWFIKTDEWGNQEWNYSFVSSTFDSAYSLVQTSDGGFVLAGATGFKHKERDLWLIKTDKEGCLSWKKTFGSNLWVIALDLIQTEDGGFAFLGAYSSNSSMWLFRTDNRGNVLWTTCLGSRFWQIKPMLIQTSDGGFAHAGRTGDKDVNGTDVLLVKTDENGSILWKRTYGGIGRDFANSLLQTSDGGFALTGGWNVLYWGYGGLRYADIWLGVTDANGILIWNLTYGHNNFDGASNLMLSSDGDFILSGSVAPNSRNGEIASSWLLKITPPSSASDKTIFSVILDICTLIVPILIFTAARLFFRKEKNGN